MDQGPIPNNGAVQSTIDMINQERTEVERSLVIRGEMDELEREATVFHHVMERVDRLEAQAQLAFRYGLWVVYRDNIFANMKIEVPDEQGEFITVHFRTYEEWFNHVTRNKSPSVKSALWNGITKFLAGVDSGRIRKPGGEEASVERMATISERNWGVMAGLANRKNKEGKLSDLGKYLDTAATGTQERLIESAKKHGDIKSDPKITGYRAFDDEGNSLVFLKLSEKQFKRIDMLISSAVEMKSVTVETLISQIGEDNDEESVD